MFAIATFFQRVFDFLLSLTGAFLDASEQFIFLTFDKLQVVIGQLREFLFHLALGDVPVSFDDKCAHNFCVLFDPT